MENEELLNECRTVIEEVCEKFGYDDVDIEGNESLKTVLLKAVPAMLQGASKDKRDLFYRMLLHTPIVITENLTKEGYEHLIEQYIGKDVNSQIIDNDVDLGEYSKTLGAGAYVSEPIFNEHMELQGKKSFIYIQKVHGRAKEFLGTSINVSHLIHELGHAWHAEYQQFEMTDSNTLKERVGNAQFIYSFSKTSDNKYEKNCIHTTGLMIEEAMNTLAEEQAMSNYMGISLDDMRKEYHRSLVPSEYQGYISDFIQYMQDRLGSDELQHYRLYGDAESITKLNALMEQTDYWKNRESDILPSSNSPRSYDEKRNIIASITNPKVQDFFKTYHEVYFPDISQMTPLDKIENVLFQKYNMNMIRYNMNIETYKAFLDRLGYEGYSLVNQAATIKEQQITAKNSNALFSKLAEQVISDDEYTVTPTTSSTTLNRESAIR